jgi:hypothetical protein
MNKLKLFNIIYFLFFNLFNIYLYTTNTFIDHQYNILVSVSIFEFINIFIELKQNNKHFIISISHHICTFIITFFGVLYYTNNACSSTLRTNLIKYVCLLLYSNLFLNLQEVFEKNILIKILFVITFLYCRIIIGFSYVISFINNISLVNHFVLNLVLISTLGFYLLSCY